jgi:hypothetical protein
MAVLIFGIWKNHLLKMSGIQGEFPQGSISASSRVHKRGPSNNQQDINRIYGEPERVIIHHYPSGSELRERGK